MKTRRHAFTLVEVILAVLIISGIMTVLLYFYQRAAMVRQTALEEAQFLAESRMFLDQLSGELRSARLAPEQFIGFEGTSNSVSFICTAIPQMARWLPNTNEPSSLQPATDLKRVQYSLLGGTNLLAVRGLDRTEEMLLEHGYLAGTNTAEFVEPAELTNSLTEAAVTNEFYFARQPLTTRIQHLHFRFWSGNEWLETWSGMELPVGVEISLGQEPMPYDAAEGYPFELFRRVVFLPHSTHPENRVVLEGEQEELTF